MQKVITLNILATVIVDSTYELMPDYKDVNYYLKTKEGKKVFPVLGFLVDGEILSFDRELDSINIEVLKYEVVKLNEV